MHKFNSLALVVLVGLLPGCHYIGAPPSKTPFGAETGVDGPFNKVANAFLADLKAGRVKEAYARTSKEYQKEVNEDQFNAIMAKNPFPSGGGTSSMGSGHGDVADSKKYHYDEKLSSGSISFTFQAVKQGDDYRVEKFSLK